MYDVHDLLNTSLEKVKSEVPKWFDHDRNFKQLISNGKIKHPVLIKFLKKNINIKKRINK